MSNVVAAIKGSMNAAKRNRSSASAWRKDAKYDNHAEDHDDHADHDYHADYYEDADDYDDHDDHREYARKKRKKLMKERKRIDKEIIKLMEAKHKN